MFIYKNSCAVAQWMNIYQNVSNILCFYYYFIYISHFQYPLFLHYILYTAINCKTFPYNILVVICMRLIHNLYIKIKIEFSVGQPKEFSFIVFKTKKYIYTNMLCFRQVLATQKLLIYYFHSSVLL